MALRSLLSGAVLLTAVLCGGTMLRAEEAAASGRWSEQKAAAWLKDHGWLRGCNFMPSTAINQLEMWQAETFDEKTIDRELGWASDLGFNSMRVFLHDLPYQQDPQAYLARLDKFLAIAAKHRIGILFVLFDSCWDPEPKLGPQHAPKPGLHNSGWVQSPGKAVLEDPAKQAHLEGYVKGVVGQFKNDKRIVGWDVWNEPDNDNASSYGKLEPKNKTDLVLPLMTKAFAWARAAGATQPLTSGVWKGTWGDPAKLSPMEKAQIELSDVISYHCYGKLDNMKECVANLRRYHRPLLCTEYMSRGSGSTFDPHLGYLKGESVAAYNWGFVSGKTQTIYPWDSWQKPYDGEPPVWFHDILRADGKPYRPEEAAYLRKTMGK